MKNARTRHITRYCCVLLGLSLLIAVLIAQAAGAAPKPPEPMLPFTMGETQKASLAKLPELGFAIDEVVDDLFSPDKAGRLVPEGRIVSKGNLFDTEVTLSLLFYDRQLHQIIVIFLDYDKAGFDRLRERIATVYDHPTKRTSSRGEEWITGGVAITLFTHSDSTAGTLEFKDLEILRKIFDNTRP